MNASKSSKLSSVNRFQLIQFGTSFIVNTLYGFISWQHWGHLSVSSSSSWCLATTLSDELSHTAVSLSWYCRGSLLRCNNRWIDLDEHDDGNYSGAHLRQTYNKISLYIKFYCSFSMFFWNKGFNLGFNLSKEGSTIQLLHVTNQLAS